MMGQAVLLLKPPENSLKKEGAADNFFSQISEILKGHKITLSAEIAIYGKFLWFFITCPQSVKNIIKGHWHSFYPQSEVDEIIDYTEKLFFSYQPRVIIGSELYYNYADLFPLKTYKEIKQNPLVSLSGVASSFGKDEAGFIQLVIQPPDKENFWNRMQKRMRQEERNKRLITNPQLKDYLNIEGEKDNSPYFNTSIRFLSSGNNTTKTQLNLISMITVYKKALERPKIQEIKEGPFYQDQKIIDKYRNREIGRSSIIGNKYRFRCSAAELATFFHLPYKDEEISQIVQIRSKRSPPPQNLPKIEDEEDRQALAPFGETTFQNEKIKFGIGIDDRRRHLYVIGKSGTGKSKLIELLITSDIQAGRGVILLDPHGDLAKEVLNFVPDNRIKDVVYFDPTDIEYPIGFNPMEGVGRFEFKQNIVSGFVSIFKKLFGLNWNERFEHVLRYTTLALLEYPKASILGIPRMLTDNLFRQEVIGHIQDPLVKKFWTTEFSTWNDQFASEAIVPIINKVGQFVANPVIRNIIGQSSSGFSFEDIINKQLIFIANLSVGKLGEENSALLGSMLVTKIWQSAISRASIPEEERKDSFMYVDEFQNFATTSFANILSEARKYRLNITLAHQYIQQLPIEVRSAILGNAGNIISFRVGGEDAQILVKEFEPTFMINDFLNLDVRNFFIKMSINGQTASPFSASTIDIIKPEENKIERIINTSRKQWARPRAVVEKEIKQWGEGVGKPKSVTDEVKEENYFPEPII